jgi:hypothetical protein
MADISQLKNSFSALHSGFNPTLDPLSVAGSSASSALLSFGVDAAASQAQLDLAKQLSMQMDYNNELLAQLQRLEEQHLLYQRGAQEKQASLKQALAVADAARGEANEAKRKLAVAQVCALSRCWQGLRRLARLCAGMGPVWLGVQLSISSFTPLGLLQDVAQRLAEENKRITAEAGTHARKCEGLERLTMEMKCVASLLSWSSEAHDTCRCRHDLDVLKEDRTAALAQIEALQRELRNVKRTAADAAAEATEQISQLTANNTLLTREIAEQRARHGTKMASLPQPRLLRASQHASLLCRPPAR